MLCHMEFYINVICCEFPVTPVMSSNRSSTALEYYLPCPSISFWVSKSKKSCYKTVSVALNLSNVDLLTSFKSGNKISIFRKLKQRFSRSDIFIRVNVITILLLEVGVVSILGQIWGSFPVKFSE